MIGKRVQPDANGYTPKLYAGEYVLVAPLRAADGREFTEEEKKQWWNQPHWMCCSPNGHVGNLEKHQVVEHEDGTITVSPSIEISWHRNGAKEVLWHGFLEHGVWREA